VSIEFVPPGPKPQYPSPSWNLGAFEASAALEISNPVPPAGTAIRFVADEDTAFEIDGALICPKPISTKP